MFSYSDNLISIGNYANEIVIVDNTKSSESLGNDLSVGFNEKILALHGGLSPNINTLAELSNINRFVETPKEGPLCDILWSDPDIDVKELMSLSHNVPFDDRINPKADMKDLKYPIINK